MKRLGSLHHYHAFKLLFISINVVGSVIFIQYVMSIKYSCILVNYFLSVNQSVYSNNL